MLKTLQRQSLISEACQFSSGGHPKTLSTGAICIFADILVSSIVLLRNCLLVQIKEVRFLPQQQISFYVCCSTSKEMPIFVAHVYMKCPW
jgi:hypothetical protein